MPGGRKSFDGTSGSLGTLTHGESRRAALIRSGGEGGCELDTVVHRVPSLISIYALFNQRYLPEANDDSYISMAVNHIAHKHCSHIRCSGTCRLQPLRSYCEAAASGCSPLKHPSNAQKKFHPITPRGPPPLCPNLTKRFPTYANLKVKADERPLVAGSAPGFS